MQVVFELKLPLSLQGIMGCGLLLSLSTAFHLHAWIDDVLYVWDMVGG